MRPTSSDWQLLLAFALLGIFPLAVKKVMAFFRPTGDRGTHRVDVSPPSKPEASVLKLRFYTMIYVPVLYSVGKAEASKRFSLVMPPGVFNRSERYFSSRPSHS